MKICNYFNNTTEIDRLKYPSKCYSLEFEIETDYQSYPVYKEIVEEGPSYITFPVQLIHNLITIPKSCKLKIYYAYASMDNHYEYYNWEVWL